MFAALNTLDGSIIARAEASSSGMDPVSQSVKFRAERQTDPYHLRQLRHLASESQLVEAQPRFHVHFTRCASWLNMVNASSGIFPNNGFGAGFSIRFLS